MSASSFPSPFTTPHSCEFCEKLVVNPCFLEDLHWGNDSLLPHPGIQSRRIQEWLNGKREYFRHRQNYESLYSTSIVLFDVTIGELRKQRSKCSLFISARPDRDLDDNEFLIGYIKDEKIDFATLSFNSNILPGEIIESPNGHYVRIKMVMYDFTFVKYALVAAEGNSSAAEIYTRPINMTPGSGASLLLSRNWLNSCLSTHSQCTKPTGNFMPSRCIEIRQLAGRPVLRLRDSNETGVKPYAALSYCWGHKQHFVTTKSTLSQRRSQIINSNLPATLWHAIEVTTGLGIHFLWVDSLCIIQDDAEDKAREINSMPMIYHESVVTIAASRASDVTEGFLHPRVYNPSIFQIPYMDLSQKLSSVFLVPDRDDDIEPLDLRAWAMQERVLSPRVLEYGSLQTRYICQTPPVEGPLTDGMGRRVFKRAKYSDETFREELKSIFEGSSNLQDSEEGLDSSADTLGIWYQIINAYSRRSLTLSSDRLPAISGIASRFVKTLGDEYCAGLWRSKLENELLWSIAPEAQPGLRVSQHHAPSWSWASIIDPVVMPLPNTPDTNFQVTSYDAQSELSTLNRPGFEFLKKGTVKLKGHLQTAFWKYEKDPKIGNGTPGRRKYEIRKWYGNVRESGLLPLVFAPDAVEQEFFSQSHVYADPKPMIVYLLKVSQDHDIAKGLVLRKISNLQYSRLGVFEFSPEHLDACFENHLARAIPEQTYAEHINWLESGTISEIIIT